MEEKKAEEEGEEGSRVRRGPLLCDDEEHFYLGPVEKIHALLNVEDYQELVKLCPPEELHGSSVQHPLDASKRWLLNTRRVKVLEQQKAEDTREGRPRCAGVGDPEEEAWLCHECASYLCHPEPKMPPKALANVNWGGREHPLYQNLTMSTRTLLGLGRLVARLVLLKPQDNTDESERAIVGNTILVAQPHPKMITRKLPPPEEDQVEYFSVVYGCDAKKMHEKKH